MAGKAVSGWFRSKVGAVIGAVLFVLSQPALAAFVQQGSKLVGTDAVDPAFRGYSVALSADGNTALVSGPNDNGGIGAVWVFIRSGGAWTQQGGKLIGSGAIINATQGYSVALSADGNTAIVGGTVDNGNHGGVWIFSRSGGVWTQQGNKLVGSGAVGISEQGTSVALSADGNTALVGGAIDNGGVGAVWVFTRSGSIWSQQGNKLVGSKAVNPAFQGTSVAISASGNIAIVGGTGDNTNTGAVWVFVRSNGVWAQHGGKLVGTGAAGAAFQGSSVALSSNGTTAIVGGSGDANGVGAAWVFTRSGSIWSQQGNKLVGTIEPHTAGGQGLSVALSGDGNTAIVGGLFDSNSNGAAWAFVRNGGVWSQLGSKLVGSGAIGAAFQGYSVALSADGATALVGGYRDNDQAGAAWVFVQSAAHDFNGDGKSDILFRNTSSGAIVGWLMDHGTVTQARTVGTATASWQVLAQRDFDGDGKADLILRNTTNGKNLLWLMNGTKKTQAVTVDSLATRWVLAGAADFNGDGKADLVWRDSISGTVKVWLMNGGQIIQSQTIKRMTLDWKIVGTGRNGQIFWFNSTTGAVMIWVMNGFQISQTYHLGALAGIWANWAIVGLGDFDGDGSTDLLLRKSDKGTLAIWLVTDGTVTQRKTIGPLASNWTVDLTGDFDGDGKSDIVLTNTATGDRSIWFMNGATVAGTADLGIVTPDMNIQSAGAE